MIAAVNRGLGRFEPLDDAAYVRYLGPFASRTESMPWSSFSNRVIWR